MTALRSAIPPAAHRRARGGRRVATALAVVSICAAACSTAGKPAAAPPAASTAAPAAARPGDGVDLAGWKLSVPTENEDGNATTVDPAALTPPFLTGDPGGVLTFWAPAEGATTKNSDHARTELNSLTTFKAGSGSHTLTASVTLQQEPADGQGVIIGQIHGSKDDGQDISSVAFVMLRLQDGQLKVVVKQVLKGEGHINYPVLDAVPTGARLDFTLGDPGDGTVTWSASVDGETEQGSAPIPGPFRSATVRFQAGDYQQSDAPAGPQDGGRIVFHQLTQSNS